MAELVSKVLARLSRGFASALAVGIVLVGLGVHSAPFRDLFDHAGRLIEEARHFDRYHVTVPGENRVFAFGEDAADASEPCAAGEHAPASGGEDGGPCAAAAERR